MRIPILLVFGLCGNSKIPADLRLPRFCRLCQLRGFGYFCRLCQVFDFGKRQDVGQGFDGFGGIGIFPYPPVNGLAYGIFSILNFPIAVNS
ncbi:hypothetical protein NEILACOT_05447 [Neisseria lactamica ATCC 23970]|uniref:Uncharacterized protein n=1 Tax=Neisseria lactamica ATCC 23970 TaxID=546265 RepID=D0WD12_NEILA|nr:hypothetical protein NEILACOT_05447 [Neisseria lactamica ATCC 23970]